MASTKPRMGARGSTKVKTGCLTCKYDSRTRCSPTLANRSHRTRRKKCDEARPTCSQCSNTGRRCDFSLGNTNHYSTNSDMALGKRSPMSSQFLRPDLPHHMRKLTHAEASYLDYFRLVCARDFAICFESTGWEKLLLRSVQLEPSIYHAALAIAALSRQQYSPPQAWYYPGSTSSATEFSILHYNLAIQNLNGRLERSIESSRLTLLACILFIHIEAFQNFPGSGTTPTLISAHLNGGIAIAHHLKSLSQNIDYLESALDHIQTQIEQFERFAA
jgi:hypothetical protein